MFTLRKLNSRGVAHHAVLMLIVVVAVAGFGAYTVAQSHADNLYSAVNSRGCHPGKEKKTANSNCSAFTNGNGVRQQGLIDSECAAYYLQKDASNNCAYNCIGGYHVNDAGACAVNAAAPAPAPAPGAGGGGGAVDDCQPLKRQDNADPKDGKCGQCFSAYFDTNGNYTKDDACVKKNCENPHNFWNESENRCACESGWFVQGDNTCKQLQNGGSNSPGNNTPTATPTTPVKTPTTTTPSTPATTTPTRPNDVPRPNGNGNGNGNGNNNNGNRNNNATIVPAACTSGQHRNTAGQCESGGCQGVVMADGTCVGKNKVDEYCDFKFLKYDKDANKCKAECKKNYSKDAAGACVPDVKPGQTPSTAAPAVQSLDTAMDRETCKTLGREWEPSGKDIDGNKVSGCSTTTCRKGDGKPVAQTDGASYCKTTLANLSS